MDLGRAFSFPFEDQEWARKIIIPALIALIPIIGQIFLIGWALDVARRVIRQDPTPLPELDFGQQLGDGFKAFVVSLVYAIPVFILEIPIIATSAMIDSSGSSAEAMGGLAAVTALCCGGLVLLYALVLGFIVPAAYTNVAIKDSIGAGLNLKEVLGLVRAAPGPYLLVFLGALLSGIIASFGIILCFIGVLLTYTYAMAVNGHLYGQAYLEATRNQGIELPNNPTAIQY